MNNKYFWMWTMKMFRPYIPVVVW